MKTINLFTCCLASAALLFTGCVRDEIVFPPPAPT